MAITMKISDNSPEDRRRMVAASGAYSVEEDTSAYKHGANYAGSKTARMPITRNAQYAGSGANVAMTQPMFFSPLHTPQNWQIASRRREVMQWARFYYMNEPKVAAGVDFYSNFSMNGFKLECKNKKVLKFYEKLVKDLDLVEKLNSISHEYFLLGDVFPFLEIQCPHCFPKDTLVLTENGNKNIQDLEVDDKVLTIEGNFKNITHTMSRKYNGDMVTIFPQSLPSIKSTDSHKHYIVRPEYRDDNRVKNAEWNKPIQVEASKIKVGDYISSPFNTKLREDVLNIFFDGSLYRKKNKHLSLKKDIELTEEFAEMMGWFVAEGSTDSNRTINYSLNLNEEVEIGDFLVRAMKKYFNLDMKIEERWIGNVLQVYGYSREISAWFDEKCGHSSLLKKVPDFIMKSSQSVKKSFIKGLLMGDGHISVKNNQNSITTISRTLCHDIISLLSSFGISCFVSEKEEQIDNLGIHRRHCYTVGWRIEEKRKNGQGTHKEDNFIFFKVKDILKEKENTVVYNITVEDNHNYIVNNFHTRNCHNRGITSDGKVCNHPDGTFRNIKIMNPDYIEVKDNPIASNPEYFLIPDEDLKLIIQRREPRKIYESLPQSLIDLISSGQPIPLSDRSISHLKHNASDYGTYGISMLQRLFTILAYKTKIMTANWIIAERLILPIRVVKVGDKDRPATEADLQDVVTQLSAVANDPNLTVVTHHAFDYEWHGAEGKIHNITQEMEEIGKEILDGLMLNQAILNGEMAGYTSAQVGIEVLIRRLDNWRNKLKNWVEEKVFKPIAMMQGFIDEEETEESGFTVYLHPQLVWNDLQLRDKTNRIQTLMQMYDKQLVSGQTVLEELDLDYDVEVEKIRDEQVMATAQGQMAGPQGGNLGTMGMGAPSMGAPGMGAPGMGGAPDVAGEGMGAPGGAPMGGAPMGAPGGGGMGAAAGVGMDMGMGGAGGAPMPMIGKRGSKSAQEQQAEETPPPQMIKLTKLEQKMYKTLLSMEIPYPLFGQYSVNVPGEQRPFSLDFAYPALGVGIETDGAIWHQRDDFQQRDMNRDQKLANVGWRILRFKENAIEEQIEAVKDIVYKNLIEAEKSMKKSAENKDIMKYASNDISSNSLHDYIVNNGNKIGCYRENIANGIQILYIGNIENEN